MSGDDECIHGLGAITACTICNGRDRREAADVPDRRTFPAKYEEQCRACNLPIAFGEIITWEPDRPIVHADCIDLIGANATT